MQYKSNNKHKAGRAAGRRGSLCPKLDAAGNRLDPSRLLAGSVLHGKKRYATDGQDAYCAQCHDGTQDLWHGYPVGWIEVPEQIRNLGLLPAPSSAAP